jgi:hypothetical protein
MTRHDDLGAMFEPVRFGGLPSEQIGVVGVPPRPRVYRRLERVESAFTRIPELHLELPHRSWLGVTGAPTDQYALVLWAETENTRQADAIVERADIQRKGDTWALGIPPDLLASEVVFRWDIVAPRERPVTITASDANVSVSDITGPVKVSVGNGQAVVHETSGPTEIRAMPRGYAVWTGRQGPVRVEADLDVYLKITEVRFDGTLDARSMQSIHLRLPRGFAAGIEADVPREAALVCRADIGRVERRTKDDRIVCISGAGPPQLRLNSRAGSIVIDNPPQNDGAR